MKDYLRTFHARLLALFAGLLLVPGAVAAVLVAAGGGEARAGRLALLALVLAATAALAAVLLWRATRRLRALGATVAHFEAGRLDVRLPDGPDELGRLAAAFNQMADTLAASLEELKRTDQLRRELIANVSHDLRSPLTSLQGYLETILMKDERLTPEERRRYMEIGLKNTKILNNLVTELFELSKLDSQQIRPRCEPFALAELVQDVVLQFRPKAERNGVRLDVALPEPVAQVYADIALVERAVANLVDNAIRYTPSGGQVCVSLTNEGDAVSVSVADTGVGIPEKDLPYVFDRFYRVEKSRDRDRGGAGLGLAIVKKIVELHGARIEVRSAPGRGSTFRFALPAWNAVFFKPGPLQAA